MKRLIKLSEVNNLYQVIKPENSRSVIQIKFSIPKPKLFQTTGLMNPLPSLDSLSYTAMVFTLMNLQLLCALGVGGKVEQASALPCVVGDPFQARAFATHVHVPAT